MHKVENKMNKHVFVKKKKCLIHDFIRSKNKWFVITVNWLAIRESQIANWNPVLFGTKQKPKKTGSLNIRHGTIQIKQYHTVTYLGCALDENLSGETMALKVISKINCRLYFATLWYNLISIMRAQLGIPTWITD